MITASRYDIITFHDDHTDLPFHSIADTANRIEFVRLIDFKTILFHCLMLENALFKNQYTFSQCTFQNLALAYILNAKTSIAVVLYFARDTLAFHVTVLFALIHILNCVFCEKYLESIQLHCHTLRDNIAETEK
jgi:hypothetical protein